ncbi:hypothetical protein EF294_16155 [Gordonia oryzae]|uniref:Uncharacterized protein n=1 Tax=Gordonia oryzae TaxID=2487349 RepID=A0A3N4GZ79_9ACTN|nr:hypothetical protein [Gordonia oryzae]RPA58284.1 hypothetical protein EF294_16155 [Gordonia oryzae]
MAPTPEKRLGRRPTHRRVRVDRIARAITSTSSATVSIHLLAAAIGLVPALDHLGDRFAGLPAPSTY